jgi:hypothetical protein
MAQSNGTPAGRSPLFALPAVTEPVSSNAGQAPVTEPVTPPVTLPLTPLAVTGNTVEGVTDPAASNTPGAEVVPLSPAERTRLAVAHWASTAANGAGQLWFNPGRLGHSLYHGKPGSLAEHRAYIKSREWRPEELKDHRSGKVIASAGVGYHLVIARPLKAACLIVSASADRPLRLTGLIAFLIVFAVFVLPHIPLI